MYTKLNIVNKVLNLFDIFFSKDLFVKEVEVLKKNLRTNKFEMKKGYKVFIKINNDIVPLKLEYYKDLNNDIVNINKFIKVNDRSRLTSLDKIDRVEQELNSGYTVFEKNKTQIDRVNNKEKNKTKQKVSVYDSYVDLLSSKLIKFAHKNDEYTPEVKDEELSDYEIRQELIKNAKSLVSETKGYNVIDSKQKTLRNDKY